MSSSTKKLIEKAKSKRSSQKMLKSPNDREYSVERAGNKYRIK